MELQHALAGGKAVGPLQLTPLGGIFFLLCCLKAVLGAYAPVLKESKYRCILKKFCHTMEVLQIGAYSWFKPVAPMTLREGEQLSPLSTGWHLSRRKRVLSLAPV